MTNHDAIDVLVIGGGNAALCAALMAAEAGARVMLLEAAPRQWRGGNSSHTRNLRCMHDAPQDVLVDAYPEEEFWQDLLKVTGGLTDEKLARLTIRASATCRDWMRKHGVHFQPPLSGALHVARTNAFFMGGGKALVNAFYRSAEKLGVKIRYNAPVDRLEIDRGRREARVDEVVSQSELAASLEKKATKKTQGAKPTAVEVIAAFLKARGASRPLVPADFPLGLARELEEQGVQVTPVAGMFRPERQVKTPAEIRMMTEATRITESGM